MNDDLTKPLGCAAYVAIGLLAGLGGGILPVLLVYWAASTGMFTDAGVSALTIAIGIPSLFTFPILLFIATRGRYGKVEIFGLANILALSVIPFLAWLVVHDLGKGMYMTMTRQRLMPRPASKAGIILLAVSAVAAGVFAVASSAAPAPSRPPPTPAPEPIPNWATYVPITQTAYAQALNPTSPYDSLEISVVKVTTHDLIWRGEDIAWYPDAGNRFVDVGVLVRNPGAPISVQWQYIGIEESNGSSWYPAFAGARTVNLGQSFDPFSIKLGDVLGAESVQFDDDTYLRLVLPVRNIRQVLLFSIKTSRSIAFNMP